MLQSDLDVVTCSNSCGLAPRRRMKFQKWSRGGYQYKFICCGHCRTSWGNCNQHGKNCFLNKTTYYVANPEYDPEYTPSARERVDKDDETTTDEEGNTMPSRTTKTRDVRSRPSHSKRRSNSRARSSRHWMRSAREGEEKRSRSRPRSPSRSRPRRSITKYFRRRSYRT